MAPTSLVVRETTSGVRIDVRVIPRASRTAVGGVRDSRLLVRVTAPPVDHAANDAVVDAIANALGVPKRAVTLVAGQTSRNKTVGIAGVGCAAVQAIVARLSLSLQRGTSVPRS